MHHFSKYKYVNMQKGRAHEKIHLSIIQIYKNYGISWIEEGKKQI